MFLSTTQLPAGFVDALQARVDGEVRADAGTRAAYSTDASNFRHVPEVVVLPRTLDAAAEVVRLCDEYAVPVVSRGGGTSLAGQGTNTGVLLDFSKYCHLLLSVDRERRRCVVEPGIVLDDLNDRLREHGLRFGPEPATHPNCTIGGMIGNNSCGATAQAYGKTADNVARLEVVLHDGTRFWCGPTEDEEYRRIEARGDRRAQVYRGLRRLRDEYADRIRAGFPRIPRRVSGYNLEALLPENGFDVARFLVGSEGTLVTVLRAELELVPVVKHRSLVVLGYPDIVHAARAVPAVDEHRPLALEGIDRYLLGDERLRDMNQQAIEELPRGTGYLMVQFGGDTLEEADQRGREFLEAMHRGSHPPAVGFFDDPQTEHDLWQVREAGLAATAHPPGQPETYEGWEDSAVHPERLADYLADLRKLFEEFGYQNELGPSLYGHFGQGCVHTRIPFGLETATGIATYRDFMERAARLVVSYGGSLSGEHGDGQERGELLPIMFGDELVEAMGRVKRLFDPAGVMNPGKIVFPRRLDEDLRLGAAYAPAQPEDLHFGYPDDAGSFIKAASRCVGVGKCRRSTHEGPTVMCPSYQVTREEEHSTRGRSRLLFEMLNGHGDGPIEDGWRSEAVREALDLCLSCKGCKRDCPAGVDMATYKAEFLAHHYKHRLRPRADYALGWLPAAAAAVDRLHLARPVNAATRSPRVARMLARAAGLEQRPMPEFATERLQQWWARRPPRTGHRGTVLLWPDTFTNSFDPHIGQAAVQVLEDAGWGVTMPTGPVCCGLTWISTGQLDVARRVLRRTVRRLADHVRAGGLVVGLEPSCTTVFRSDAPDMMPEDLDVRRLRDRTVTLAELLREHTPGWEPPRLEGIRAVAQVHCHQHAVLSWEADRQLLHDAGAEAEQLASGCCGLAGNFGFTAGHGEVSEACAEQVLLPRLRQEPADTVVLADGFSCRTQIHQLDSGPHEGRHLAELLAEGLARQASPEDPDRRRRA